VLARWGCDVQGSGFCRDDYVTILREETAVYHWVVKTMVGRFDLSTVSVDGIFFRHMFRSRHGSVCLQIRISLLNTLSRSCVTNLYGIIIGRGC